MPGHPIPVTDDASQPSALVIFMRPAELKVGASVPGKWDCGSKTYTITLSITLQDKAGHRSEPYNFSMVCD